MLFALPVVSTVVVEARWPVELDNDRERLAASPHAVPSSVAAWTKARAGLDSFAAAALEVAVGQIDALESRRSMLRAQSEQDRAARLREREELLDAARRRSEEVDAVVLIDLDPVRRRTCDPAGAVGALLPLLDEYVFSAVSWILWTT